MIITVVAGAGKGKSGAAHWLAEKLKSLGATQVTIHDADTTEEQALAVAENYEKIMKLAVIPQHIHIVTKQSNKLSEHEVLSKITGKDYFQQFTE
jgi:hypothetical protein